ncbi:glycosyltransferase [Streptomyces sp. NBC_00335]|uniref:glycosyltransferase n=1 Tax=Streptomyces sp. NBC_00086 TaxID=2903618 RepID=UPI002254B797|nr:MULTISPECIES: glycosyltransferase [unclassified Streptomyces]MCX5406685.1 glycosyltransferase [Streptomyces sp. NBC_00086]
MSPGKVLHVITGLGVGGAEQQLRLLLRHMPMRCDVLTLTNPGPVAEGLRADGVRVVHLGMRGNRDLGAMPKLVKFIRRGRYDLVHTHLYRACVYGRLAARLAGVRVSVATEHSLGAGEIEGRPLTGGVRGLYLASERLGAATVAVSDTVAARLEAWGVPAGRVHVVPNGIEAVRFRFDEGVRRATRTRTGLPERAFVVGGVGRLVPGKRFDVLVRAVAALPGAHLLLAGDGPERAALRRLAAELGAQSRIHLLGERDPLGDSTDGRTPGIPALLAAMDVFVSPSKEEAFGLAVIEALAAGLPVLHVTCPAIDDLPAAQAPGARRIGTGTEELVAALRGHMEAGVRRLPPPGVVRRYDIGRSAEQLLRVYDLAMAGSPAGSRRAVALPGPGRGSRGADPAGPDRAAPLPGAGPRTPAPHTPEVLDLAQAGSGRAAPLPGAGPRTPAPHMPEGLSLAREGLDVPPAGLGLPAAGGDIG